MRPSLRAGDPMFSGMPKKYRSLQKPLDQGPSGIAQHASRHWL
jgi:hypothetical protein